MEELKKCSTESFVGVDEGMDEHTSVAVFYEGVFVLLQGLGQTGVFLPERIAECHPGSDVEKLRNILRGVLQEVDDWFSLL